MKSIFRKAVLLSFSFSSILTPIDFLGSSLQANECPAETNLAEYLTDQIDMRAAAIVEEERLASKNIFLVKDINTGEGYIYNENNWLRQDLGLEYQPLNLSGTSFWGNQHKNKFPGSLVTPQHVVVAKHAHMSSGYSGGEYSFIDHDGVVHKRSIVKQAHVFDEAHYRRNRPSGAEEDPDIVIQELNEPLPASVHVYKIIDPKDLSEYINVPNGLEIPAVNFNQFDEAGTRDMSSFEHDISYATGSHSATESYTVRFHLPQGDQDRVDFAHTMVDGDSGDAAFLVVDNELALLMTNFYATRGPGHGGYIDVMNTIIDDWGTTPYQVERVNLECFEKENSLPEITSTEDLYIKIDAHVGASFGRIDVQDSEDGNNLDRFILWGNGEDRDLFILNRENGLISVAGFVPDLNNRSIVSDTDSQIALHPGEVFDLELVVQDNNIVRGSGRGNVRVTLVEDNSSPVILPQELQDSLLVQARINSPGTVFTQYVAEDPDGDSFVWSIRDGVCSGSGNETPFEMISNTGELILSEDPTKNILLDKDLNSSCLLTIEVTDSGSPTRSDIYQTEIIINDPPIVSAGSDQIINLPTSNVTLIASASDSDGTIVSRSWSQVSGPNSAILSGVATNTLEVAGLLKGVYVFRFDVTDDRNGSVSDTVEIVVNQSSSTGGGGGGGRSSSQKEEEKGCTDKTAINYDKDADKDDESCIYEENQTTENLNTAERERILKEQIKTLLIQLLEILKEKLRIILLEKGITNGEVVR